MPFFPSSRVKIGQPTAESLVRRNFFDGLAPSGMDRRPDTLTTYYPDRSGLGATIDAFGRAAGNHVSLGAGNSFAAAMNSVVPLGNPRNVSAWKTGNFREAFLANLNTQRLLDQVDRQQHPWAVRAGGMYGDYLLSRLLPPIGRGLILNTGKSAIREGLAGADVVRPIAGGAIASVRGAAIGGVKGFTQSDDRTLSGRLREAHKRGAEEAAKALLLAGPKNALKRIVSR